VGLSAEGNRILVAEEEAFLLPNLAVAEGRERRNRDLSDLAALNAELLGGGPIVGVAEMGIEGLDSRLSVSQSLF